MGGKHPKHPHRKEISFEEFTEFIHQWAKIPNRTQIVPQTSFEEDLGITGDDGGDQLKATEEYFGVSLSTPVDGYRRAFRLAPNEFLFHGEGFWRSQPLNLTLSRDDSDPPVIRNFTAGELFQAVKPAAGRIST